MLKFFIILSFTTIIRSLNFSTPNCTVLALEGGGDAGSYQAGVIYGLAKYLPPKDVLWNVVTGVSVGSINGAGLSIFKVGEELEAGAWLTQLWSQIKGHGDIFDNWSEWGVLSPLYALFEKTGLFTTSPLRDLLIKSLGTRKLERSFILGATNVENGEYDSYDEETLNDYNDYISAVMASAAFPVIFPNIIFRNKTYIDGGVKYSVDIASGINKCRDYGYSDDKIVVDVILCNNKQITKETKELRPLSALNRVFQIWSYDSTMRDLNSIVQFFPKVNFRFIISPTKTLPSGAIPLDFSPAEIQQMIQDGIDDAKNKIIGEGGDFMSFLKLYNDQQKDKYNNMRSKPKTKKPSD